MEILYSDEHIVVVNKPRGLLSVPGVGPHKQDCAMNRVRALFPESVEIPVVHRLDQATAGLLVFGISAFAQRELSIQFAKRRVDKRYIAVLEGDVRGDSGEITLPTRLDIFNRPYQIYDPIHGKIGITEWGVLERRRGRTRVEFIPITGRTHQLRFHAAHKFGLGCPIVGDFLYGNAEDGDMLHLHAAYLRFCHPATEEEMAFCSVPEF